MIDNSVLKRLAIQYGAEVLTNDSLYTFEGYELQDFAQAVIEDYKAKLRPVTVNSSYAGIELKLYALPSGETK